MTRLQSHCPDGEDSEERSGMDKSPREIYEHELGTEFGRVFFELWRGWSSAVVRLDEYRALYGNPDDVDLLNRFAGHFFGVLQTILWDDLLLCVTRLTDPPRSVGRDNLSIAQLPNYCEDQALRKEVEDGVDRARVEAEFARDWRNRRISHSDLNQVLEADRDPLAEANLKKVSVALDGVHCVLNTISMKLRNTDIANLVVGQPGASVLLARMKRLVNSVLFIDSIIDPGGNTSYPDSYLVKDFLRKFGQPHTSEQRRRIFELQAEARRFK